MKVRLVLPRTRLERVEKLAAAGMYIANGVAVFLAVTHRTEWTVAASGCLMALTVVNAAAGIRRRPAGQRLGASRPERVEKLAGFGVWATVSVALSLSSTGTNWTFLPSGFVIALSAVTVAATIQRRRAALRLEPGEGSGRSGPGQVDGGSGASGHGGEDDAGAAAETAYGRRTLAAVSRLMPASAGRRWLAEAESVLAEVGAARRGASVRSYLLSAPRLAVTMWAHEVLRRARLGPRRPG
jgi:hypothetical protein